MVDGMVLGRRAGVLTLNPFLRLPVPPLSVLADTPANLLAIWVVN